MSFNTSLRVVLAAFASGVLFASGLVIAGMTQPSKVLGFLDFFGQWDPSLMWVMLGAVAVNASFTWKILRREAPLFLPGFSVPPVARGKWWSQVSVRLVAGAALFGVGWGLSGYCPGPALVSFPSLLGTEGAAMAPVFVGAMMLGMLLFSAYDRYSNRQPH